jgi:hypothetical protein
MRKLWLLLLLAASAFAQNTVTVTAANIPNGSSGLLAAGTILFQSVNSSGQIITYQVGGTGPSFSSPTVCSIASGAITGSCSLPNVLTTNPPNICFQTTIKNTSNVVILGGPGSPYSCIQPTIYSSWCSAGVCDFDDYFPTIPNNVYVLQMPPPSPTNLGGIYSGTCNPGYVVTGYSTQGLPQCAQGGGGGAGNFSVNGVPLGATNLIDFLSSAPVNGQTFTFTNAPNTGNIQLGVSGALNVPGGGSGATNLTGILKGNGASAFTPAVAADVVGLFSGCSDGLLLGADGACHSGTGVPLGAAAQVPIMNAGATAYAPQTVGGDGTLAATGALLVTKTNGAAFGPLATQATPCTVAQGCTGTTGTLTGLVRGGATYTAAELSGQVVTAGSNVAKVTGLTFGSTPFSLTTAPTALLPCIGYLTSTTVGGTACGGGGSVAQYALAYGGASALQGLAAPTTPTGLNYFAVSTPSGGATNPVFLASGMATRNIITSTDSITTPDCNFARIQSSTAGVVTEALSTATALGDSGCAFEVILPLNSSTTQVNFTTSWTINGAVASAFNLVPGQLARFTPDPAAPTSNWAADKVPLVGGGVITYRTCTIVLGADNGSALVNLDLNQKHQCFFPKASTVVEVDVEANSAAASLPTALSVNDYSGGTVTNLFGSTTTLPVTATTGAVVCARATTSTSCFVGTSSSTVSLTTTALAGGDWIDLSNGAADGTTSRVTVVVTYTTP